MTKFGKFCQYYLQCFSSSGVLECRIKNCCQPINHAKSVQLPEEGEYLYFQNYKRLTKAQFTIYAVDKFLNDMRK